MMGNKGMQKAVKPRLFANTKISPDTECILWTGCTTKAGYGQLSVLGKRLYTHRVSYEIFVGKIEEGLQIDHLCRVRNCIRPDHLEQVTSAENTRRGSANRLATGGYPRRTHCKREHALTDDNVYTYDGKRSCRTCIKNRKSTKRDKSVTQP